MRGRSKRNTRKNKIEFAVADIETIKAYKDEEFNSKFYIAGVYSNERKFQAFENVLDFLKELESYKVVFFHNLNFDLQVILKACENQNVKCISSLSGSRIINARLEVSGIKVNMADSMNIYNMSLEKLEKSFHIERETSNIKHDRENIEKYSKSELIKYLKEDCLHLYNILNDTFKFYGTIKMTIASLSYFKLLNEYLFEKYKKEDIIVKHSDWVRNAYKGGRVEVFKRYGKNLFYYDVNSLYPTVMCFNQFPLGRGFYTNKYIPNKLGIYHIYIKEYIPNYVSLLSLKHDNKLVFVEGQNYEAYLSSAEIEYMKKNSKVFNFEVKKGVYFDRADFIFSEFITYFYEERKRLKQEKNPLEQVYKLTMNSSYGKFAEKEEKEFVEYMTEEPENIEGVEFDPDNPDYVYLRKVKKQPTKTNIAIASFITAYARIYLTSIIEKLMSNGFEVYYCDTDSIVTNANEKQMELLGIQISEELGALKLEYEIEEGFFIVPKVYQIRTKEKDVIKAKGFDLKTMTSNDILKAFRGEDFVNKTKRMLKIKSAMRKRAFVKIERVEKRLLNKISDKRIYINENSYTLDKLYEKKNILETCILLASKKYENILDKEYYYYLNRLGYLEDCLTNKKEVYEEFFNMVFEYDENVRVKDYVYKNKRMRVRRKKKTTKEALINFFFENIITSKDKHNIDELDIAF